MARNYGPQKATCQGETLPIRGLGIVSFEDCLTANVIWWSRSVRSIREALWRSGLLANTVEVKLLRVVVTIGLIFAIVTQTCPLEAQGSAPRQPTAEQRASVRAGLWGGHEVEMQVNEQGARVEFPCAKGNISVPLLLDPQGKFRVLGTFQPLHGGPTRRDENASDMNVTYIGAVKGDTMKLELILPEKQQPNGPFTLVRGQMAHLRKCQ